MDRIVRETYGCVLKVRELTGSDRPSRSSLPDQEKVGTIGTSVASRTLCLVEVCLDLVVEEVLVYKRLVTGYGPRTLPTYSGDST